MPQPRFLCDEMLQGLGRWLRAAGYDTLIAESGEHDARLLDLAQRTGRRLITRDRKLMERRQAAASAVLLNASLMPNCLEEVTRKLAINWLYQPFSRCMLCNTPLRTADDDEADHVPEDIRHNNNPILFCPKCQKAYWEGGHVRRMRAKLAAFQQGRWH